MSSGATAYTKRWCSDEYLGDVEAVGYVEVAADDGPIIDIGEFQRLSQITAADAVDYHGGYLESGAIQSFTWNGVTFEASYCYSNVQVPAAQLRAALIGDTTLAATPTIKRPDSEGGPWSVSWRNAVEQIPDTEHATGPLLRGLLVLHLLTRSPGVLHDLLLLDETVPAERDTRPQGRDEAGWKEWLAVRQRVRDAAQELLGGALPPEEACQQVAQWFDDLPPRAKRPDRKANAKKKVQRAIAAALSKLDAPDLRAAIGSLINYTGDMVCFGGRKIRSPSKAPD